MDALLSMPIPMSSSLMVLLAIAAIMFIKVIALIISPSDTRPNRRHAESRAIGSNPARVAESQPGRRRTDKDWMASA